MKKENTMIHTTLATGTDKVGPRSKYRNHREASAARAFAAVTEAHGGNPLTMRKRTRCLGHKPE